VVPWMPEGFHDIEWSTEGGQIATTVCRGAIDDRVDILQHSGTYGSDQPSLETRIIKLVAPPATGECVYDALLEANPVVQDTFPGCGKWIDCTPIWAQHLQKSIV